MLNGRVGRKAEWVVLAVSGPSAFRLLGGKADATLGRVDKV